MNEMEKSNGQMVPVVLTKKKMRQVQIFVVIRRSMCDHFALEFSNQDTLCFSN